MTVKRYAAKRDSNEQPIIEALRAAGATVQQTDFCDLIVGYQGENFLLEVKSSGGRLTKSQKRLLTDWQGQYAVVWNIDDALEVIGALD